MALAIRTVADSISKISITGLAIKDLDTIPASVLARDCPMLIPAPNFLSSFTPTRVDLTTQEQDLRYTLTYRLLSAPVGSGRGIHELYDTMVTNIAAFLDAILTNHAVTGAVDIRAMNVGMFGVVTDPAGGNFHGCDIAIEVLEFL